jgi:hypothetical protein
MLLGERPVISRILSHGWFGTIVVRCRFGEFRITAVVTTAKAAMIIPFVRLTWDHRMVGAPP